MSNLEFAVTAISLWTLVMYIIAYIEPANQWAIRKLSDTYDKIVSVWPSSKNLFLICPPLFSILWLIYFISKV